jgi:hypothetical protein
MKILNLSYDDYANFGHENANALRSIGLNCVDLKRVKHGFGYGTESKVSTSSDIMSQIKKCDVLQLFHSDSTWLKYAYELGKKIYVYHTGTTFRQNSEHCNNIFNPYVNAAFTDQCEFMGLGMKNEKYIATAINTNKFQCTNWNVNDNYVIAHYPSNASVKGTVHIKKMLNELNIKDYLIDTAILKHDSQIERMSMCDIYIELFSPQQNGKPYGCFGVTSFEAASLGKLVITNNIRNDVYEKEYGETPFFIANCETKFKSTLQHLLSLDKQKIQELQEKTRSLMLERHSYVATGNYIKKALDL